MLPAPLVPRTALELQIALYRRMTGEERLALALRLHESVCAIARLGIRARHPEASDDELEQRLHARIALGRRKGGA